MQTLIVNTPLKPIQKNIFLYLSFFLFSIDSHHSLVLMINLKSAKEMGVTVPDDLKNQAKMIGEKS